MKTKLLTPIYTCILTLMLVEVANLCLLLWIETYENIFLTQHRYLWEQIKLIKIVLEISCLVVLIEGARRTLSLLKRRIEIPLRYLTQVIQAWQMGQMEARMSYSSTDEIGSLVKFLNAMAAKIDRRQKLTLNRTQKLEDLIAALSHDLRTPLLAARNTLHSMLNGAFGSIDDSWEKIFQEFYQANENNLKLVEALLDISRYEASSGKNLIYEPLDWEKIFTQILTRNDAVWQYRSKIAYKISPSLPTVYGDRLEIQRVLQNLLDNAVRASKPDRPILLEVIFLDSAYVRVLVCDRGMGISSQEQQQLFHRFVQGRARRGKVGLGLYLCRQIIEAHKGSIGVESFIGRGSTFWFNLPVETQSTGKTTDENEA